MKSQKHQFTKEEIRSIVSLWETKSTQQIADELGLSVGSVTYMAAQVRNAGFNLPKKRRQSMCNLLIEEALTGILDKREIKPKQNKRKA